MTVGVLRIELSIPGTHSLKEKRMVLKSLKTRLRNNFNISVAEVAMQDKWQKAIVGIAAVNEDKRYLNGQLDKVIDFIEGFRDTQIIDYEMELC
ncbi:MAG: DUF503 domain-containing protein [Candidatus Omnitrophica bacterium]|nr:DUF503 domain-containing protein [Candidatus Omnitrophota bacterium]